MQKMPAEIDLKAMFRAYDKMMYQLPIKAFDKTIATLDKLSTRRCMRTGYTAAITMPCSILLRHAVNGAKFFRQGGGAVFSHLAAFGGGLAGWFMAGKAAAGFMATAIPAVAGMPALATYALAGAVTLPTLIPCLALGVIAVSGAAFGAGLFLGHLPAIANLPIAVGRTIDRIKGHKNMNYGEVFSDDPPPQTVTPAPTLAEIEEEFGLKPKKSVTPDFNGEAATKLDADITYKKIKLKVKAPAA